MALTLGGMSYDPRLGYAGLRRVNRVERRYTTYGFLSGAFRGK
jgi:hypothetical protein